MRARLCVLVLLAAFAAAQEQASQKQTCGISGTVVRADGSQPIAKAKVRLRVRTEEKDADQDEANERSSVTEADGTFHFDGITCTRYALEAERTGYLPIRFGDRSFFSGGAPIRLTAGQKLSGITLHMVASAVITGKVTDGDGEPASNISVSALRPYRFRGKRQTVPAALEKTNDLGEYRLHDLAPGKYYVRAGGEDRGGAFGFSIRQFQEPEPAPAAAVQPKFVDTATYYSGTAQMEQATPIELRAGDEIHIDLSLLRVPAVKVRGRVVGGGRQTMLFISGRGGLEPMQAPVKSDGTFELAQIAAGSYTISAVSVPDNISDVGDAFSKMKKGSVRVTVGNNDLDGVVINLALAGQVTMRGQFSGLQNGADYRKIMIAAVSDKVGDDDDLFGEMMGEGGMSYAILKQDGSFEMKGLKPGVYRVAVQATDPKLRDYFVQSMTSAGADVLASGLRITGAAPQPLLVTISNAGAQLEGSVVDAKSQPQVGVTVVAVPAPEYRKQPDLFQTETTDQNGHFAFRGLRPGDYTVLALDGLQGEEYQDPEFLAQYESRGAKVKLRERETGSAQLTLISVASE